MTALKPFQEETVKVVVEAFKDKNRSRRFLVADEVGLGKTVVAQEVIKQLMRYRRTPLVVFYFCSNLSIASQNRTKILEVVPDDKGRAVCDVDRLTLLPALAKKERPSHHGLHLYTLTPETSMPLRRGKRRDGKKEERALIHNLVKSIWPGFFKLKGIGEDYFRFSAGEENWPIYVNQERRKVWGNKALKQDYLAALLVEFNAADIQSLRQKMKEMDKHQLMGHLRNALATTALDVVKPDLIIFDEFQRFRDLVAPNPDAVDESLSDREREIIEAENRVLTRLRGDHFKKEEKPALLLLSATPYRLYAQRWEDADGYAHHAEFFELIEFLHGADVHARQKRTGCEAAFTQLGHELRQGRPNSPAASNARDQAQALLRPVMARTERLSSRLQSMNGRLESVPAPLQTEDLKVFKHLSDSFRGDHRTSAVTYWNSIPLPMQTMGPHYITWDKAGAVPPDGAAHLTEKQRNQFALDDSWPHPRLRALQEKLASPEKLALPWLPPSLPWWELKGNWQAAAKEDTSKFLIFSRFRAVPQAVSALLSLQVETELLARQRLKYSDVTKRKALQARPKRQLLLAIFHPSPWLVTITDPLAAKSRSMKKIQATVRQQIIDSLRKLSISIVPHQQKKGVLTRLRERTGNLPPPRTIWQLLAQIENRAGYWPTSYQAWKRVAANLKTDENEAGLARLLPGWDKAAAQSLNQVTDKEVDELVELTLSAPGVVIGRALYRHWPQAVADKENLAITLDVVWNGLRTYLDQRWFFVALKGEDEDSFPQAIRQAVLDGNLEAVLDEHLWIIQQIRSHSGAELAQALKRGLTIRSSNFYLYQAGNKNADDAFSLRCHAALPFTQAQTRARASQSKNQDDDREPKLRADELRTSFNSPFWPHVLVTTSVGQEGLDFHVWCDSLVHWDLCANPVDMEQREGRIQRYGGLAIRRTIARKLGAKALTDIRPGVSPWQKLAGMADKELTNGDPSGLTPWWICEGAEIKRYTFEVPLSEQTRRWQWLQEQRLLYRLALGQPNQEDLVELLARQYQLPEEEIRQGMLQLSPWFGGQE